MVECFLGDQHYNDNKKQNTLRSILLESNVSTYKNSRSSCSLSLHYPCMT